MKKISLAFILLLLVSLVSCNKVKPIPGPNIPDRIVSEQESGTLKIMSFNIRSFTTEENVRDNWCMRADAVRDMMIDQKSSIIGLQELSESYEYEYVAEVMSPLGYSMIDSETCMSHIMYLEDDLDLLDTGVFWQSNTPDKPSECWDTYTRVVRWAIFEIKATGTRFFYVNTHMGLNAESQQKGMALIVKRIPMYNTDNLPVVFTADCNVGQTSSAFTDFRKTMDNAQEVAPITDEVPTYNAWGNEAKANLIDMIWLSKDLECLEYRTVTEHYDGHKYISDHYPVYSIIKF